MDSFCRAFIVFEEVPYRLVEFFAVDLLLVKKPTGMSATARLTSTEGVSETVGRFALVVPNAPYSLT
ncbi:hypothetical protein DM828_14810 [Pseudomonas umsongensis]|nr:hypothetical protein [Pseudomonas umsongensis]